MRAKLSNSVIQNAQSQAKRYLLRDSRTVGLSLKVEPSGTKVFIFEYRLNGFPSQRYNIGRFGAPWTLEQARREAGRLRAIVDQGADPLELRRKAEREADEAHTVFELSERMMKHLEHLERRPSTLRDYGLLWRRVILPKLGRLLVSEVTTHQVEQFHAQRKSKPYQANRALAVLSRAFNLAERWGWRQQGTNPTRFVDRYKETRRGAKKGAMLSPAQISRLLAVLDEEQAKRSDPFNIAAIRLAFWTGWRLHSEILRLRWENLDFEVGQARLIATKTADEEYRSMPEEAVKILQALPRFAGSPWVFPSKDISKPKMTVGKIWNRIRERAGLVDLPDLGRFRIHDLRHNAVSWDVSRGVSLKVAGANVGHKSIQATEIYSHFAPDHLRAAADARSRTMREAAGLAQQ